MKRGRVSMALNAERSGIEPAEFSHILINYSSPFSDFPRDILVNILLRLSVKRIFVCKFVCKTWYDLISEPGFAKLHFDQAQAYPLIQIAGYTTRSRMLYLVQPKVEDFERKLDMCDHSQYKSQCDCHVKFELDAKLKLPLRNPQMIFDVKDSGWKRLKKKDYNYRIVNSCNGLLCLSSPFDDIPLVVCNPVTGEFINLPEAKKDDLHGHAMSCGFGFSPATNRYKVIMFRHRTRDVKSIMSNDFCIGAEVHILGTKTWKDIDFSIQPAYKTYPTYLNGFLYWIRRTEPLGVISFDIENESNESISTPIMNNCTVNMGVLGGELSIFCYIMPNLEVWALKDYGTANVWSKVFSVELFFDKRLPFGPCQPIKYLNDGALLIFHPHTSSLIYMHPRKPRFRYFMLRGTEAEVEVIAHIPSFVSLKDALLGYNVKVLNVKSRCAELKLQNEDSSISILETDILWFRPR